MKRVKKPIRLGLEIIAVLNMNSESLVASKQEEYVEYQELDSEYQLTNKQLSDYQNFVRSCLSVIKKCQFDVVEKYQIDKSYSYYFHFTPVPYSDFQDSPLQLYVKFRLFDHYQNIASVVGSDASTENEGVTFKAFVVEGVAHDNIAAALKDIRDICIDIKHGNIGGAKCLKEFW